MTDALFDTVDLFAGPGGWEEAARRMGLRTIGLEIDAAACATRAAARHTTIRADVTTYPTTPCTGVRRLIGSPPCQPYSQGGHRDGLADMSLAHQAIHDLARGDDTRVRLQPATRDPRSLLVAEPMRYAVVLRPETIALEQVSAVLPIWRQYAEVLRGWGYSTWAGILNTADYGLEQTRRRAILIASRVRAVDPPTPTHSEHGGAAVLFGSALPRWRTMADGLGWGYTTRPAPTITGGGTATGGAEPWSSTSRRAMRAAMDNPGHWAWHRPAHTISGTVGHVDGKQAGGHLNLTPAEAARLQGFPDGFPFQGNKGQVALQIGNAVPPRLAGHVLAAATGIPAPALRR